jgi:hypothetical protein
MPFEQVTAPARGPTSETSYFCWPDRTVLASANTSRGPATSSDWTPSNITMATFMP